MPGVVVTTATRSGPSAPLRSPSGQLFVVGLAERGPTTKAVLVKGLADFEAVYGPRVSYGYLHDTLKTFFEEGGIQAYVARTVGPAATKGTVQLMDRAGTPIATLTANAASAGDWATRTKVVVTAGALANTVKITITLDDIAVESYDNLASPAEIAAKFGTSNYVNFVDLASATASPNNLPAIATTPLVGGTDDRAAITTTHYTAALNFFVKGFGDGAVAVPGQGTTMHAAINDHCKLNRRIGLLSHTVSASISDLSTAAAALNSDCVGVFAPWVRVSDGAGGYRTIPPEGYVAGVRARAHETVGPWRTPAGGIAEARNLVGLNVEYTETEGNQLDAARVSVIRRVANTNRLYGWRSLSSDEGNYAMLSVRDLLNFLTVVSETKIEQFVFAPVDGKGQLLSAINAELVGIAEPIRMAGGIFESYNDAGDLLDPGYSVETGSSVNTPANLEQNVVNARLSVRPSPSAALIHVTIVRVGLTAGI